MDKPFKPLAPAPEKKTRRLKWAMLALIVVIAALVIAIKTLPRQQQPAITEPPEELPPKVELNKIVPPMRTPPPPPQPAVIQPPSAAPTASMPTTAAPTAQPAANVSAQPAGLEASPAVAPAAPGLTEQPAAPESGAQTAPTSAAQSAGLADSQTSPQAQQMIEQALNLRDVGKLIPARDLFNEALNYPLSPQVREGVKMQLSKLAEQWLFSGKVLEGDKLTAYYIVQPGDLLAKIGKKHNVPYEILQKVNNIPRPESLAAGRRIKVIYGPFHAVVNKTTFTMDLYLQTMYVKTYRVGLGRPEHTTPTGRWLVAKGGKMIKPTWTDPDTGKTYLGTDPDYPLGSRWIALEGIEGDAKGRTGFAIHGTKEPETIGTQSSRGCIRLFNGDVIEVYDLLEPGLSYVQVVN